MDKYTFIYALIDPRNNSIRYIGKADEEKERFTTHIYFAKKDIGNNKHKNNWIKRILKENLLPIISIIDQVPFAEWQFWERHYISLYKSWGFKLLNMTNGGDGGDTMSGRKQSEETCRRKSIAFKGINKGKPSPRKGVHLLQQTKDKIAEKRLDTKHTTESIKKMSVRKMGEGNPMYNRKHSEQTLEIMRLVQLNKKASDETRKKMSLKKKDVKWTEEALAKAAATRKANKLIIEQERLTMIF